MRIAQLTPALSFGDAVGNDVLAIDGILSEAGYETGIYTDVLDRRLPPDTAAPIADMPRLARDDILLYHACTGAQLNFDLVGFGGKKVMVYHNITPPRFFHDWNPGIERIQSFAYEGMRFLSDKVDRCIADSEYNRRDLLDMGYACPIDVCPILIPYEDYRRPPADEVLRRYDDGRTNLLFVGRIAPNKRQEDVIRAYCCYRRQYDPGARLFLVGSSGGMEAYERQLRAYADTLGVGDGVVFPGHIRFDEILAYYRLADVFVCMSEHEGFCVPLVEAMLLDTPIVAYRCTAVPDTLGGGGLLLEDKDPYYAAAAIDRVVRDEALRRHIARAQRRVLDRFSYDSVRRQLLACLERAAGA